MNALVPELSVSDINKSLNFYLNILLFKLEYQRPEDKFALLSLDDCQIMIEEINDYWKTGELSYPFGRGINFQIVVNNSNELYENVRIHQYPIKIEIQDNWYRADTKLIGQKEFLIVDPDGYLLRFAQNLGEREYEEDPVVGE
ncbi:bleomycin resistance protein [Peribacillus cavernae]|nr:VOC family protein [Peribacillus cavernae]MDQ0218133.1 catechol 2,3-dioxygenase-like lactoylglutathione lyase family enzyme [Peribacillus cavernae]